MTRYHLEILFLMHILKPPSKHLPCIRHKLRIGHNYACDEQAFPPHCPYRFYNSPRQDIVGDPKLNHSCMRNRAHDHSRPELNGWLKSLHSKAKTWCCDGNDTDTIEDWDTKGGRYRVKWQGLWYDVPDDALVEGPNKSGAPLLWMSKGYMAPTVRCFMPGTLS